MKFKTLFSTLFFTTLSSALFAGFTATDAVSEDSNPVSGGKSFSGSGSVDELITAGGSNEYYFIRFQGTNINFDSDKELKTTATNVKLGTYLYSFKIEKAPTTLNFTGKGALNLANSSTNGGMYISQATTMNFEKGCGGLQTGKIAVADTDLSVFNINEKNAIYSNTKSDPILCLVVGKAARFNLTADQAFSMDLRHNSTVNVSATAGSNLIFSSVSQVSLQSSGNAPVSKINFLEDFEGAVLIDTDSLTSFDVENKQVVVNEGSKNCVLNFTADSGFDWDSITWTEDFMYEGNSYLRIGVAVPEPAEWAMIFGAIALGFAIYRRRK